MAVTSEESAAFEHLAKSAPRPDDRVFLALEAELGQAPAEGVGRAVAHRPPAPRYLASWQGRVVVSLALVTLVLLITTLPALKVQGPAVLLFAIAGGLGLCSMLVPSAVPGPTRAGLGQRQLLVGLVALLTVVYVAVIIGEFDHWSIVTAKVPWSRVMGCAAHVLFTGALCLVALLGPWRRSDPFSPTLLGGLLGALAGYSGMLAVDSACASTEGFHVLFGHASAVVVFGLLGALLGRRWLSP